MCVINVGRDDNLRKPIRLINRYIEELSAGGLDHKCPVAPDWQKQERTPKIGFDGKKIREDASAVIEKSSGDQAAAKAAFDAFHSAYVSLDNSSTVDDDLRLVEQAGHVLQTVAFGVQNPS